VILADYRFSVTVSTSDEAVLACLRALAEMSQDTGNRRIVTRSSSSGEAGTAKFRFSERGYRERFLRSAQRLLPKRSWSIERSEDMDPAPAAVLMNVVLAGEEPCDRA